MSVLLRTTRSVALACTLQLRYTPKRLPLAPPPIGGVYGTALVTLAPVSIGSRKPAALKISAGFGSERNRYTTFPICTRGARRPTPTRQRDTRAAIYKRRGTRSSAAHACRPGAGTQARGHAATGHAATRLLATHTRGYWPRTRARTRTRARAPAGPATRRALPRAAAAPPPPAAEITAGP